MKRAILMCCSPLVLSLMLFSIPSGFAQGGERVLVTVLEASNQGRDFNLDNDAYRDQLIRLFSYSSYQQINSVAVQLPKSALQKIALPEGYDLNLTLQAVEGGRIVVHAQINKGAVSYVDTSLAITKPGVVFLGGPPSAEGVLILILEAGS